MCLVPQIALYSWNVNYLYMCALVLLDVYMCAHVLLDVCMCAHVHVHVLLDVHMYNVYVLFDVYLSCLPHRQSWTHVVSGIRIH